MGITIERDGESEREIYVEMGIGIEREMQRWG